MIHLLPSISYVILLLNPEKYREDENNLLLMQFRRHSSFSSGVAPIMLNKFNQRIASTLDIAQLVIGASALLLNGFIMIFQG